MDLVFDKSGMSINGVPLLMYSQDNVDFTNDIITVLNKPGRAASSTAKGKSIRHSGKSCEALTFKFDNSEIHAS